MTHTDRLHQRAGWCQGVYVYMWSWCLRNPLFFASYTINQEVNQTVCAQSQLRHLVRHPSTSLKQVKNSANEKVMKSVMEKSHHILSERKMAQGVIHDMFYEKCNWKKVMHLLLCTFFCSYDTGEVNEYSENETYDFVHRPCLCISFFPPVLTDTS